MDIRIACEEMDVSPAQLAEMLGIKTQSIRNMLSTGKVSKQVARSIEILLENKKLKEELKDFYLMKEILNKPSI